MLTIQCPGTLLTCVVCTCMQASPGVVTCLEGHLHGMSTGDLITFREVVGMEVNGTTHTIKGRAIHVHLGYGTVCIIIRVISAVLVATFEST